MRCAQIEGRGYDASHPTTLRAAPVASLRFVQKRAKPRQEDMDMSGTGKAVDSKSGVECKAWKTPQGACYLVMHGNFIKIP